MRIDSLSPEASLLLTLSHGNTPRQAMQAWCAAYTERHGGDENAAKMAYFEACIELERR
jgi:hypothetical protein